MNVPDIRGSLSWFNAHHNNLRINASEGINYYLTLDWLNGINDYGNSSWVKHFLRFLSLNISTWKPGSKTWMGVIPTNTHLISANLLHHVHELLLENGINWFDTDRCSFLRHRENINHCDCVVVVNFSNHKSHYFERNTWTSMLQHL